MKRTRMLTIAATALLVVPLSYFLSWTGTPYVAPAYAAPPGGNGGGGGPTGVIYFSRTIPFTGTQLWFMNADGTDKTPLPAGVGGEPSWDLHNGKRWFLRFGDIAGETNPAGGQRVELFAVREDGVSVQLTDQADLHASGTPRWAFDPASGFVDGVVSWVARRFDSLGNVVEGGIYSAEVAYDGNGEVAGLVVPPGAPLIPGESPAAPDIISHDWAPTGTSLVYESGGGTRGDGLWVVDDVTNPGSTTRNLTADGFPPAWSPDGSKIAFKSAITYPAFSIFTINPDGSGQKDIIESGPTTTVLQPRWSPTGSHVLFLKWFQWTSGERDVFLAKANGRNQTNLTSDIDDDARPVAWREGPGAGGAGVCGDGVLDPGETPCTCPEDAGDPLPDEVGFCHDGIDNDCDGFIDCDDANCGDPYPGCPIQLCVVGAGWVQEDGGCKDPATGLVWSLVVGNRTWNFALQYADELIEGGLSDWRLPTKAELETAAANMILDNLTATRIWVWSSTKNRNEIWWVNLRNGSSGSSLKATGLPFYCVRESQP